MTSKRARKHCSAHLSEAGVTLVDCQGFEYRVALLLFYLGRLGNKGHDPGKLSRILDNKDKKTVGQLIIVLKKNVRVSDGIESALREALLARNRLIHRVLIDDAEQIPQAGTRAVLVKESLTNTMSQLTLALLLACRA